MSDLASAVVRFCELLRVGHGFAIGRTQTHDALRAAEIVGITKRERLRAALRAVCCMRAQDVGIFDPAFDAFFASAIRGEPQPSRPQRHRANESNEAAAQRKSSYGLESKSLAQQWQALQAQYSPIQAAAQPPPISREGYDTADAIARRLISRLHLQRSRRLRPQPRGRPDFRRTVRASLQTGGEIVALRRLGRPLRDARFIIVVDASRSMRDYAPAALQIAHAFCRRTRLASAFVFSTALREVTRELRTMRTDGDPLVGIGEAWGGGTRIGACLRAFTRNFRARLDDRTYVIVVSDGLDVGEIDELQRAMREISRRCAAIAWVNPLAEQPGYRPAARGMLAVLPYVTMLTTWPELAHA
jgi:uncharacterized protein